MRLKEKVVLVTGSTTGIGEGMARRFALEGAHVVVHALKIKDGYPEGWPDRLPRAYAPAGRIMSPDHVASAVAFFLSDEAPLVNGSVIDFEQYPMIGRNPVKESL